MAGKFCDSAKELECHFKWSLETDALKTASDVIRNVEEKLKIEPLNSVPYLCLLAYLHTTKGNLSYIKAYDYLKQAERLNKEIDSGLLSTDYVGCKFVVEANRLNIDAIRAEKTADHGDRIVKLRNMWNDADENARNAVRASVLLVKSLSCLRFGPTKYQMGADAAAESASLSQTSFHGVFLQAIMRARFRRLDCVRSTPDADEFNLWADALRLTEQSHHDNRRDFSCVQLATVKVLFAEAVVHDATQQELAESLADQAKSLLTTMAESLVEKNFRIVLKCAKIYRILKTSEKAKQMLAVLALLKDRTRKPQLLYDLAIQAIKEKNYSEYERLLVRAQEVSDSSGHIWVDLSLVRLRSSANCSRRLSMEETLLVYDELLAKYDDRKRKAVLCYYKGEFYAMRKSPEKAMEWMVKSVDLVPNIRKTIRPKNFTIMLKNMERCNYAIEWRAWFIDNLLTDSQDALTVQRLYQEVLDSNPTNQFALQHYGMNRIRAGNFQEAESLFRSLDQSCHSKRRLLSEALLHQIDDAELETECDINKLKECLSLGCKDACCLAECLLQRSSQMDDSVLMKCIRDRWLSDGSASLDGAQITPFSTCLFEVSAQMEHQMQSHSSFFISEDLDTAQFPARVADSVQRFMMRQTTSAGHSIRRGNTMRENRLKSSRLFITDPEFATAELNDAIVAVLKESKESLDRSFHEFVQRSGNAGAHQNREFYPHGFNYAIAEIERNKDYNVQKKKLAGAVEKKLHEMNGLIKFLSGESNFDALESNISRKLPNMFDLPICADDAETAVRHLLARRESVIIHSQGSWLVLWQYMVNLEKHARKTDIAELNSLLGECNRTTGVLGSPRNAYQMMHLAALFAEETALILDAACNL